MTGIIVRMVVRALLLALLSALPARACDTALLLALDVSNSVDPGEYRLQIDGLAEALADPFIAEILVRDRIALSVMQWSGTDRQTISLPWKQMLSPVHVTRFAARVRGLERAFVLSNTAPAEALRFALRHFGAAPDCKRFILNLSADGTPRRGAKCGA